RSPPPTRLRVVGRGRGWGAMREDMLVPQVPPTPTLPTARKRSRGEGADRVLGRFIDPHKVSEIRDGVDIGRRAMMQGLGRRLMRLLVAALTILAAASPSLAFPDRPVRIIVPYAPGGGNDALARVLGQKLEEQWGKPVIIENKSGGNTIIATDYVSKQPADGYTILMVSTVFAVNPSLLTKLPYDTLASFTPIVLAGMAPNVLVTKPALPVNSVKQLIDHAHANPGKLTYGFPGAGTTPHLAVELFNSDANIKAVGVVFRGTQPQLM